MPDAQPAITRIAQLELKDEQRLVKEGYDLLDEKRIRLVAEMRTQLALLRPWQETLRKSRAAASSDLRAALSRHGADELSVYPPLSGDGGALGFGRTRIFGVEILEVQWHEAPAVLREQPVNPSSEARACALGHRAMLGPLVQVAVRSVNLRRLLREYVRTERRARAIENVLLPDIQSRLKFVEEQLEILDQEEIARVRESSRSTA
jgi:V/A-type H+-transporting ATPase subunit D